MRKWQNPDRQTDRPTTDNHVVGEYLCVNNSKTFSVSGIFAHLRSFFIRKKDCKSGKRVKKCITKAISAFSVIIFVIGIVPMRDNNGFFSIESYAQDEVQQRTVNVSELRYSNAVVTNDGQTFIFTVKDASNIMCLYPSLKDGTAITFSNFTGNVGTSKNGTLFARNSGFATATIDGEKYTILFDFGNGSTDNGQSNSGDEPSNVVEQRDVNVSELRYSNAVVTNDGQTFIFTVKDASNIMCLYPSLKDGTAITFSNFTGNVGTSKNGTLFARNSGFATATIDGEEYTIQFDFGKKDRDIERLLRYSGAELCVQGRVITLNVKTGSDYISVFPSLTDGTEITFSNLTGDTGISRNGTLYSRSNATAIATIDGTAYIIVFYFFPEESLGNNTDDIDAFSGHKYFVGHKNNQKTISIKEEFPTIGRYYINNKGDLIASSSNYIKKLDLSKYIPTTIKCQSRSSSWYSYAFYSSTDTFDSTTFISGGKVKTSKTDTTFDIVGIPKNALTMLAVRYSSTTWEAIGYEATGDYPYCDVKDAMDQWKNDGYPDARIYKQEQAPKVIYHVGNGQEYSDLISAVKRWIADEKPCATIYVDKGEYITQNDPAGSNNPLLIRGSANRLTIIGEDKESTIVRSTTGEYVHPAINIQGGNVTVKNITFVADHTSNPNFSYLDYAKRLNSAYAVHCDGGAESGVVPGVIEFENCNMWSWQSCGLGCGTVENGHIIVKDCDIRSFVPGTKTDEGKVNGTDEEKEAHAKYVHGTRGAITYHTKSGVDRSSNESFTLINTSVYLKGGTKVVNIKNGSSQDFKLLTFINNTFHNDIESCNVIAIPKSLYLCALSSGNNIGTVNSDGSGYSLMIK